MEKIKGFHLMQEAEEASNELDGMVEELLITLRLKGQSQLYCFDITHDKQLRNLVLATMSEDYEESETTKEN